MSLGCVSLSPAYLESRWSSEEWHAALYENKLFAIRIADSNPEGLLGSRVYLDLVGASEDKARELILTELMKREGLEPRAKTKPSFPRGASEKRRPHFPGCLPSVWNITEERNPYFTGRDELLDKLHQALTEGKTAALTQAIKGLGGVGKTQLALEYAYRYASEYDGVWWVHAEEPTTSAHDYAELAPHLGVAVIADQGQMVRELRQALSQSERILLIFDDANEPELIKPYLPTGPARRVVVTTRVKSWPGANSRNVNELSQEFAVDFPHAHGSKRQGGRAGSSAAPWVPALGARSGRGLR